MVLDTNPTQTSTAPANGIKERTVLALFAELERRGIRYAVMRNYEAYPSFGHDADTAIHPGDIAAWEACLSELAPGLGWEALTRCHHWDSPYAHQSPKSFLLYKTEPDLDFICLDLFHGATLWGLPLYGVEDVLGDAVRDERGFFRMAPQRENLLRLLQVDALIGRHQDASKVQRYSERIRAWWPEHGEATLRLGRRLLGPTFGPAARRLVDGDLQGFKSRMRLARLSFLARQGLRDPLASVDQVRARFRGRWHEVAGAQCGFTICVPDASESQRQDLRRALELVGATFAIRDWTEAGAYETATLGRERLDMEQGGIAVKWVRGAHDSQELDIAAFESPEAIAREIFRLLIERHEQLWRRES